ncbi:GNAT family N-acetyltransferase [Vibrio navarrensis]|uniref:GNAT family N-acetyltransferase n=1 Tax=Vibrio TaxID=662 RepID=UPI0005EDF01C|nr:MULTISPECIES: N-acetyltransferase [Vibrio]KJR21286.1 hypothetical protein UF06_20750 [Vibrio sp. S234-5]MBE3662271.1 GNAT family N-acetyltransferase [Vibrio navarrensis]MBE4603835.1 GNAT family N-acetyltransferase [Vibrio navarrensis]
MNLHIRNANREDIHAIAQLEQQLFAEHGYPIFFIRQALDCWPGGVYVAQVDRQLAGYVLIAPTDHSADEAWMLSLAVSSSHQGQGIARKLVRHALAHTGQYQKIKLTVAPENEPALRLYQSEGFQLIDRESNYFGDGEERLVMCYQRESTA